jgi:ubiquitin carboxyl-terminal hydrolase 7
MEQIRRKERNEAHLYMSVQVLLEDSFDGHQGNDLYDPDRALYRVFRVRKQTTLQELLEQLADSLVSNITVLWISVCCACICRPLCLDIWGRFQTNEMCSA